MARAEANGLCFERALLTRADLVSAGLERFVHQWRRAVRLAVHPDLSPREDHDGEARAVRLAFEALSQQDQDALILFLEDL